MTSKTNPVCRICGAELTDENWYPSHRKNKSHICKTCNTKQARQWQKANPDKVKAQSVRYRRKQGMRPYKENQECPAYLGVHVAEGVLSRVFKNVKRMPYGNPGFDFICGKGYMIDIKGSCLQKNDTWAFYINHNRIADYFLCIAFDNREDLDPLHLWLIPGGVLNHLKGASISLPTIHKWDAYRLDVTKVAFCCDAMR